jgi:hypothetical protein
MLIVVTAPADVTTITTFGENNVEPFPPAIPFPGQQQNTDLPDDSLAVSVGEYGVDTGFRVQGLTSSGGDDAFNFSFASGGNDFFDVTIEESSTGYIFNLSAVGLPEPIRR